MLIPSALTSFSLKSLFISVSASKRGIQEKTNKKSSFLICSIEFIEYFSRQIIYSQIEIGISRMWNCSLTISSTLFYEQNVGKPTRKTMICAMSVFGSIKIAQQNCRSNQYLFYCRERQYFIYFIFHQRP